MGLSRTLSTPEIGAFVAGLRGRAVPYEVAAVRRWIEEEGLPAHQENGRWWAESQDILDWMKGRGELGEEEEKKRTAVASNPGTSSRRQKPEGPKPSRSRTAPVPATPVPAKPKAAVATKTPRPSAPPKPIEVGKVPKTPTDSKPAAAGKTPRKNPALGASVKGGTTGSKGKKQGDARETATHPAKEALHGKK